MVHEITSIRQRCAPIGLMLLVVSVLCIWPNTGQASITVNEYMILRAEAKSGNRGAEARWRYYIIGLMDGIQAVQGPAAAKGSELHFCMPPSLPISPKFLDQFIQNAIDRMAGDGSLKGRIRQPMAIMVALELAEAYPCAPN